MKKLNSWGRRVIAMFLLLLGFLPIQAKTVIFTVDPNDESGVVFWDDATNPTSSTKVNGLVRLSITYKANSKLNDSDPNHVVYNLRDNSDLNFSYLGESEKGGITEIKIHNGFDSNGERLKYGSQLLPYSNRVFAWTSSIPQKDVMLTVVPGQSDDYDEQLYISVSKIEVTYDEGEPEVPEVPSIECFTVTAESGEGGIVSIAGIDGEGKAEANSEVEISFGANDGYELTSVLVNGVEMLNSVSESKLSIKVESDINVVATFSQKLYAVTFGENISVKTGENTIVSGATLPHGTKLEITVEAPEMKVINSVTICGVSQTVANDKVAVFTHELTDACEIVATFEDVPAPQEYSITWDTTVEGAEILVYNNKTLKLYSSGEKVAAGTEIYIIAEDAKGYVISKLTVNSTEYTNHDSEKTNQIKTGVFTVNNDITISVEVEKEQSNFSVSWVADSNCSIMVKKTTGGDNEISPLTVQEGKSVFVTIIPDDGYVLKTVVPSELLSDDGTVVNKEITVSRNLEISATTERIAEYTVNWSVNDDAGATVIITAGETALANGNSVRKGKVVSVSVTPSKGYNLENVKINEIDQALNDGTFSKELTVDAAVNIEVTVKKKEYSLTVSGHENATVTVDGVDYSASTKLTHGEESEIKVKASSGYRLISLTLDGETTNTDGLSEKTLKIKPEKDVSLVIVTAEIPSQGINWTVSENAEISVTVNGQKIDNGAQIQDGTELIVKIAAKEGYELESVEIGGVSYPLDDVSTFETQITVSGTISIKAEVKPKQYHLTVTAEKAVVLINGKPYTEDLTVAFGAKISITAEADEGFAIKSLLVNGTVKDQPVSVTVESDLIIIVETEKVEEQDKAERFNVTWTINDETGVTVKVSNSEGQVVNGSSLENGSIVNIDVLANDGYEIETIMINGANQQLTDGKLNVSVTLDKALNIIITVKKKEYQLKVTVPENATVIVSQNGETIPVGAPLAVGSKVTVKVTAKSGYELETVTIGKTQYTPEDKTTFEMEITVSGELNIIVTLRGIQTHEVKWTASEGVVIEMSQNGKALESGSTVMHESSVRISVRPNEGYELKEVAVNGTVTELTDKSKYETEMKVTAPLELKASAALKSYKIEVKGGEQAEVAVDGVTVSNDMEFTHGRNIAITVKAKSGYEIAGLELNGTVLPIGEAKSEATVVVRVEKNLLLNLIMRQKSRYQVKWNTPTGVDVTVTKVGGQQIASGDSIESGSEVKLKIVAKTGYRIGVVKIADDAMNVAVDTLFESTVTIAGPTPIEIWTTQADKYPVVWSNYDGGKIEVRRADDGVVLKSGESVTKGTRIKARIEPENGCKILTILVNNKEQTLTSTTDAMEIQITVDTPTTINARFERPKCMVVAIVNDSLCGTARIAGYGPDEAVEFASGKLIILVAEPAEGCEFVGWLRDGVAINGGPSLSLTIDKSAKFIAQFKSKLYDKHSVRFELSHPEHGKVRIKQLEDQNLDLDVKAGQKFDTTRRILAEAESSDPDTEFEKWTDSDGKIVGQEPRVVYASHYDGVLKACFVRMVTLNYSCDDGGQVSAEDADGEPIESGEKVRDDVAVVLKMRPDSGFKVESVNVNGQMLPADSLKVEAGGLTLASIVVKEATTVIVKYKAGTDAIDSISADDEHGEATYYDLRGAKLGNILPSTPGIYIEVRNGKSRKIRVGGR